MTDAGGAGALSSAVENGTGEPHGACSVSLVVPCYSLERLDDIRALLDSVAKQTTPVDELLVVVQKSESLLAQVGEMLSRMRLAAARVLYVDVEPRVALARNVGVRHARGDIIAFADDDAVLAETWCDRTRAFYAGHPNAIGVAGAILPLWEAPSMVWFPKELYWMVSCTYWQSSLPIVVRNGYGANMSFRRAAFDGERVFNERLGISGWGTGGWRGVGGEEPEFSRRVVKATGRSVYYVPDIIVWHRVRKYRLAVRSLMRRAYWEGRFKAAFRRDSAHGEHILDTERELLGILAREGYARVRSLRSRPGVALRQGATTFLALTGVGAGYLEGTMRRNRVSHDG